MEKYYANFGRRFVRVEIATTNKMESSQSSQQQKRNSVSVIETEHDDDVEVLLLSMQSI